MKIQSIIIRIIILIVSFGLSHFFAFPFAEWYKENYIVSYDFYIGPTPAYLDGLVIFYVFFVSLFFPLYTSNLKSGFYWSLPALLLLLLTGSLNPQLWLSLVLLAVGLGLAWIILQIKDKIGKKESLH